MMASKRSAINCLSYAQVFTAFVLIYAARILHGYTNPADVAAINGLYAALGYPSLPGWVANGGDPCTDSWQGVLCNNTDISAIILTDANLGGELGDSLSSFSSITEIQLSNNNIGGSIPSNLPVTLQTLFLSDNELSGSIPSSLSSLTQLSAMSLNGNQLTGEIPDAFQGLIGLFNLDLSSNSLSGQLPPSVENLSSLTTLHLQNNQLSGTLDVLQDLPLKDLNIENNLFNGPIPDKLLSIPTFKKDGNPFNSTIAPLPSPTSPTTPSPAPPSSGKAPGRKPYEPCAPEESNAEKTTKRVVFISIAGAFIILALAILLLVPRYQQRRRQETDKIVEGVKVAINECLPSADQRREETDKIVEGVKVAITEWLPSTDQQRQEEVDKIVKGVKVAISEWLHSTFWVPITGEWLHSTFLGPFTSIFVINREVNQGICAPQGSNPGTAG